MPTIQKKVEEITTRQEFNEFLQECQKNHSMPYAYAKGEGFYEDNKLIAVRWLSINVQKNDDFLSNLKDKNSNFNEKITKPTLICLNENETIGEAVCREIYSPFTEEDCSIIMLYPTKESLTEKAPTTAEDAFCRLTMISRLEFKPNELNLDNIFSLLPTLVWTMKGVMTEDTWKNEFMKNNVIQPIAVDKFPPMYWGAPIPKGVRIADPSRVRLGAYLSSGTTVMHEGFVNFNAGTLGACMVEGRISAGVVVGKDSDLGGGCSIMGTLSGGGKEKITIGENCLIGANAGTGISLGDRCTIEAGLYVTVGMKIFVSSSRFGFGEKNYVNASELSGKTDMLLRRDSHSGVVELLWNEKPNKLNKVLH